MNEKLKDELKKLIANKPMNYGQCCNSRGYENLKASILNATPLLLSDFYEFKTRIFWILHDITEFPKCCICGKDVVQNIRTLKTGYNKNKEWENSDLFNTACDCLLCKRKKQANDFKKTCLDKYGVTNVFQTDWCKNKITETCLKTSGCTRSGNSKEGREKARQTWLETYGVDHPLKSKTVREQVQQTCLDRYGVVSYTQTEEYRVNHARCNLNRMLEKIKIDPEIEFLDFSEFNTISSTTEIWDIPITCRCKKCGTEFKHKLGFNNYYKYGTVSSCPKCHPISSTSKAENDLYDFICQYIDKDKIIRNTRSLIPPLEIDLYVPEKKIAIEFDGLFWHSTKNGIPKDYHLNKTNRCESVGVQLIHVFENEWEFKRDIVKSRIANLFGKWDNTIYARSCEVKTVDSSLSKKFQNENHIQGAINASVSLGLYSDNELVALMTFGRCRFDKKHEWEMLRFCTKLGYHIPGGASKLLKHFETIYKPNSIVSYADRRWSQGKLYFALGFSLSHISKPDYWYWNYRKSGFILESRLKYQKHKLCSILKSFDPRKSEVENMKDNDFYQVFDCGNYVFEKILKQ